MRKEIVEEAKARINGFTNKEMLIYCIDRIDKVYDNIDKVYDKLDKGTGKIANNRTEIEKNTTRIHYTWKIGGVIVAVIATCSTVYGALRW